MRVLCELPNQGQFRTNIHVHRCDFPSISLRQCKRTTSTLLSQLCFVIFESNPLYSISQTLFRICFFGSLQSLPFSFDFFFAFLVCIFSHLDCLLPIAHCLYHQSVLVTFAFGIINDYWIQRKKVNCPSVLLRCIKLLSPANGRETWTFASNKKWREKNTLK